jgi:hypothetical protein
MRNLLHLAALVLLVVGVSYGAHAQQEGQGADGATHSGDQGGHPAARSGNGQ